MSWLGQALHVARKDLHRLRWLLLGYAVMIVWATAGALGVIPLRIWLEVPPLFFVVMAGLLATALLIQSDPAWRSDAFWASRPLEPMAVFAGKMFVLFGFILGLPLVAQAVGLASLELGAATLRVLLGQTVLSSLFWLGLAAVVAVLTPDLRTFVVAFVVAFVGGGTVMTLVVARLQFVGGPDGASTAVMTSVGGAGPPSWLLPVAVVAMLGLAGAVYWSRSRRLGAGLAGLLLVFVLVATSAFPAMPGLDRADSLPPELRREVEFRAELAPPPAMRLHLYTTVAGAAGDSLEYSVVWPSLYVQVAGGEPQPLRINHWTLTQVPAQQPLGATVRLAREEAADAGGAAVQLTAREYELLAGGAALLIEAQVHARAPRAIGRMRLVEGAAATAGGFRSRIAHLTRSEDEITAQIETVGVRHGSDPLQGATGKDLSGYLLDANRSVALNLITGSTASSSVGMVLPGGSGTRNQVWLRTSHGMAGQISTAMPQAEQDRAAFAVADWAELVLVRWQPVGGYRVSARIGVE